MARVTGPNGATVSLPDDVAVSLVGDGSGDHVYAPEPSPEPAPAPQVKRVPRKRAAARKTD